VMLDASVATALLRCPAPLADRPGFLSRRSHGSGMRRTAFRQAACKRPLLRGDQLKSTIGAGYAGADTGEDESRGYRLKQFKYR